MTAYITRPFRDEDRAPLVVTSESHEDNAPMLAINKLMKAAA